MKNAVSINKTGAALLCGAALVALVFVLLGAWQVQRLGWKLDLIAAVEQRAYGTPQELPTPEDFSPSEDEYLRVETVGQFDHSASTLVKAITELGPGYWVMAPFETAMGAVWVNRGFVPQDLDDAQYWEQPDGEVSLVGLVRLSVPNGTLLERNDPAIDRWVSRDVAALSADHGISNSLPYFIDAEHLAQTGTWPRGGMTILTFRNNHLPYALTWFAMAILMIAGMIYVWRAGLLVAQSEDPQS